MSKPFFISTSIPYVNAAPHMGHAEEFVQADIIARYQRLRGRDVYFLSGTDDNSLKNVLKAEEAGEPVPQYVGRHADIFEELLASLSISNNDFIRTSSDTRHARGAQKLWDNFTSEDVFKKKYIGKYCVGCEEFKTPKELTEKGECPEHPGKSLQDVEEENYFFRLKNYEKTILQKIESGELTIVPESRKNEVVSFLKGGLEDLSISRSEARAKGWGVRVPGDEEQVMYVWVDALSNYTNALGYADATANYEKYWNGSADRVHAIGKGITRFHAIYWPAFLLSAGESLPTHLFVHGYITAGGQKMSKSLGNGIDPRDTVGKYGSEAFRYFIAREVSTFEDSDVTEERFAAAYNGNLVNGLGNQVARLMKLAEVNLEAPIAPPDVSEFPIEYTAPLDQFNINEAVNYVWSRITALDERITREEPFKVVKVDLERGRAIIRECLEELYEIARLLQPFMPKTSDTVQEAIRANKKPENLFPRV